MRRLPRSGPTAAAAAVALLAACSTTPETAPPASSDETTSATATASSSEATEEPAPSTWPEAETVATGLRTPWSAVVVGTSVLVSERDTARIVEITADGEMREAAVVDGVAPDGEGGLLGLAVADDSLFVYSTASDGNRVQRFGIEGEPGSLALGDPVTLISGMPSARIHNGGRVEIGPDGMLYVTVGDAADPGLAQDPDSRAGAILRLTPDGDVPADNPIDASPAYSYGHRNVQGIDWTDDGRLFASELGQNTWDELNEVVAGGNHGWPEVEGEGGEDAGYVDPVQVWSTDVASPSGLAIVDDVIYVANLRGERLRTIPVSDPSASQEWLVGEHGRLRDVLEGPDGRIWVLTNGADGDDRVLALDPYTG